MSAFALPVLKKELGLNKYLEDIKKFPILSENEENTLALDWHENGNLLAAHKLVTSHLRLVAKIAMQFKGYGLPMMDVISEGNIGLMTAVKKFNPHLGYRLATYAVWWVKATIQDYILKSWSMVKMGTSSVNKKLFFNLRKIKNKLLHIHDGQVQANESELIAKELDVSKFQVEETSHNFDAQYGSLNSVIGSDDSGGLEMINTIIEPSANQETTLLESDHYSHMQRKFTLALGRLDPRERTIIEQRRLQETPTKLKVLSQEFAVSNERIRQIEDRAMQKLITFVKEQQS